MNQNNFTDCEVPREMRCTYRSKPCPNERARKRNGSLHKLCQTHRLKANKTQREMQRRLREQRRQQQVERQMTAMQVKDEDLNTLELLEDFLKVEIPLELDTDEELDMWDIPEPLEEPVDLNPEDIELLVALLGTSRTA